MDDKQLVEILIQYDITDVEEVRQVVKFIRAGDLPGLIAKKILRRNATLELWSDTQPSLEVRYPVEEGPHKSIVGIVIGACGNGKTALMNNICGTTHDVGEGLHSKTRNITAERVAYLEMSKFKVYDTPGTTSQQEVPKHATLLRASLTHRPVNVIFINIKYDCRGIEFIRDMRSQTYIVEKYADHVVYLVSHMDMSENPSTLIQDSYKEMERLGMNQQVVFYSNKKCDRKKLANLLYRIGTNHAPVKIEISEEDFLQRFRVGCFDLQFKKQFEDSFKEMDELTEAYIKCAVSLPDNQEKEQIIQELALDLKYSLKAQLDLFIEKAKDMMFTLDYYGIYYALQKTIIDADERFHSTIRPYIEFRMLHQSKGNQNESIFDLIKQCPSCKLIWYRVESCPNTTCGNRPSSFWDYSVGRSYFTYRVERAGNVIKVVKKQPLSNSSRSQIKLDKGLESQVQESKRYKGEWEIKQAEKECRERLEKCLKQENELINLQKSAPKAAGKPSYTNNDWIEMIECLKGMTNYLFSQQDNDKSNSLLAQNEARKLIASLRPMLDRLTERLERFSSFKKVAEKAAYFRQMVLPLIRQLDQLGQDKKIPLVELVSRMRNVWHILRQRVEIMHSIITHRNHEEFSPTGRSFNELKDQLIALSKFFWEFEKAETVKRQGFEVQLDSMKKCAVNTVDLFTTIEQLASKSLPSQEKIAAELLENMEKAAQLKIKIREALPENLSSQLMQPCNEQLSVQKELIDAKLYNLQKTRIPECRRALNQVEHEIRKENSKKRVVGCGHRMNFDELPRISNIEAILNEWYNVTDLKQLQEKLRADEHIRIEQSKLDELVRENLKSLMKCEDEELTKKPPKQQ